MSESFVFGFVFLILAGGGGLGCLAWLAGREGLAWLGGLGGLSWAELGWLGWAGLGCWAGPGWAGPWARLGRVGAGMVAVGAAWNLFFFFFHTRLTKI